MINLRYLIFNKKFLIFLGVLLFAINIYLFMQIITVKNNILKARTISLNAKESTFKYQQPEMTPKSDNFNHYKIMEMLFEKTNELFLESFTSSKVSKENFYYEFRVVFNLKGKYDQIIKYLLDLTEIVKVEEVILLQDVAEFIALKVGFKVYYIIK